MLSRFPEATAFGSIISSKSCALSLFSPCGLTCGNAEIGGYQYVNYLNLKLAISNGLCKDFQEKKADRHIFFKCLLSYRFRRYSIFGNDSLHIFFEFGNMAYNQTPQKFRFHRIVAMYYAVACVNHSFCIWQWKITLDFQNTVYGFSHYLTALLRR